MANILVLGSASMDATFETQDFPRPGDEVEGTVKIRPGGKGLYQAIACRRLRAPTSFICSVGRDEWGSKILEYLQREGVTTLPEVHESSILDENFTTDIVGIISAVNARTSYISCRRHSTAVENYIETDGTVNMALANCHVILVSLDIDNDAIRKLIDMAHALQKPVIISASPTRGAPLTLLNGVQYVIVTKDEAFAWLQKNGHFNARLSSDVPSEEIGRALLGYRARGVVITQDDAGCVVIHKEDKASKAYGAYQAEALRIGYTGTRSAFSAGFAVRYAERLSETAGPVQADGDVISYAAAARFRAQLGQRGANSMPDRDDVLGHIRRHGPVQEL